MEEDKYYVDVVEYNYGTNKQEIVSGHLSVYLIARSLGLPQFTYLLSNFLNCGGKDFSVGKKIGLEFRNDHRTLQGLLYRFCLGIICGLAEQEYTDPRNEIAVQGSKKIAKMIEDGELQRGYMI